MSLLMLRYKNRNCRRKDESAKTMKKDTSYVCGNEKGKKWIFHIIDNRKATAGCII